MIDTRMPAKMTFSCIQDLLDLTVHPKNSVIVFYFKMLLNQKYCFHAFDNLIQHSSNSGHIEENPLLKVFW